MKKTGIMGISILCVKEWKEKKKEEKKKEEKLTLKVCLGTIS